MSGVIVFVGPSLRSVDTVRLPAEVQCWPPVARGDVLRALVERPRALVVIDGFFHARPAIPHKELLYALDAGVRVLGAASMGALRAAELAPLGMEGVGRVVDWFRDGRIEGDDEVAVLHEPPEQGYRPTTLALVEIRWVLGALRRAKAITRSQAEAAIEAVAGLPFVERRPDVVQARLQPHLGETVTATALTHLGRSGLKRVDARKAIRAALEPPSPTVPVPSLPERHTETRYLAYYREWSLGSPAPHETTTGSTRQVSARFGEALRLFQLFHPQAAPWMRQLRQRFLLATATRRLLVSDGDPPSVRTVTSERRRIESQAVSARHLPEPEIDAEARLRVDARRAEEHFGGSLQAQEALAEALGVPQEPSLEVLLERQFDALPPWVAIRAFVVCPALDPALDLARRVVRIDQAFQSGTGRRRLPIPARLELAAKLWGCSPDTVLENGARRGLFPGDGYSPGLHDVLAAVFPAEGLDLSIRDYEEAKQALITTSLDFESDQVSS